MRESIALRGMVSDRGLRRENTVLLQQFLSGQEKKVIETAHLPPYTACRVYHRLWWIRHVQDILGLFHIQKAVPPGCGDQQTN